MTKEKKLPTLLALFLIIGLLLSLGLLKSRAIFFSGASGETAPKEIKVSNTTDNSFTVSWITSKKAGGLVIVSKDGKDLLFPDYRDKTGEIGLFETHYVEAVGLEANSEYSFSVVSDGDKFDQSAGQVLTAKTARPIGGDLPVANLASGKVKTDTGDWAGGAIVYVQFDGATLLSSLVTSDGNWAISLARAFMMDLSGLVDPSTQQSASEEIFVQGGSLGLATALAEADNDDPVPLITLGGQYDFTEVTDFAPGVPIPTLATSQKGLPVGSEGLGSGGLTEFKFLNPDEGEMLQGSRPEFFGSGQEGTTFTIKVESATVYEAKLEVDEDGQWRWTPPGDLGPGNHKVTIEYLDPETGQTQTISRTFVLAAGSSDLPSFSATPSGQTTTPTLSPTLIPTTTPIPTIAPTVPVRTSQPSTESAIPQSGSWQPTVLLLTAGLASVVLVALLAVL
ncbi:MAG: Ig-like domain-containing protein [Patescibacteria group bacterium]